MKKTPIYIVAGVLIVAVTFFGGMQYQSSKMPQRGQGGFGGAGGVNLQGMRQGQGAGLNRNGGANFTAGEILSKDDKSITVKMRDNSTKIIFVSGSAKVTKNVEGTLNDLAVGKNVSVSGKTNSDGSLTAESIQVVPAAMIPTGVSAPINIKQKQAGDQQNGGFPGGMPPPPGMPTAY